MGLAHCGGNQHHKRLLAPATFTFLDRVRLAKAMARAERASAKVSGKLPLLSHASCALSNNLAALADWTLFVDHWPTRLLQNKAKKKRKNVSL